MYMKEKLNRLSADAMTGYVVLKYLDPEVLRSSVTLSEQLNQSSYGSEEEYEYEMRYLDDHLLVVLKVRTRFSRFRFGNV